MQNLLNKQNLINLLVTILVLVFLVYLVYPITKVIFSGSQPAPVMEAEGEAEGEAETEKFNSEVMSEEKAGTLPAEAPHVNSQAGTIIDGPGFEKGEVDDTYQEVSTGIPSNYYFLDDGAGGEMSIQHNLCSKSCCSEQWPTPHLNKYDPYVCQNSEKFVPSRIFCNNSFQDSGCLCLSRKQAQFLYNRGGNGREWF